MSTPYCAGRQSRETQQLYSTNPYSRKSLAFHQWCAGWNDEDIRVNNTRYFVNDASRLVRTDDTGKYSPSASWREVALVEWEEFRKTTKARKRK